MKKIIPPFTLLLVLFFTLGMVSLSSAQHYRGNFSRGYSKTYRNDYGSVYRVHPNFSFRPPVISGPRYAPIVRHSYAPVVIGPRYYALPRGSISITFGGNPYYYYGGSFYRPFGGYFQLIFPPVGIRIGMLPVGYIPIYVGADPYYFYNGTYFRRYRTDSYEVVDAPMGAQLSSLPKGSKSVTINGEKFYELNGTYYKEDINAKGKVVYTVVGKNGEINNTEEAPLPAAPREDLKGI